ncbi:hypothetical protein A2U01_0041293 [Trifolium medium]|uniref:Uncharacterized protein n=1 Tax=Trifolium medium TaxID=97028 RepID=A0A392Q8C0_9FABA|nr:hypothetical protein [Trifolium medium]
MDFGRGQGQIRGLSLKSGVASLGDDYRRWARMMILARQDEASPGERVAVSRQKPWNFLTWSRQARASDRT